MGMVAPAYYAADMVRALPDDGNISEVVRTYLRKEGVGHAYSSRPDLSWGLSDVLVSPDLFVVPLEEARRLDRQCLRTVPLAAEVLSPRADRFTKRRLYQERDVPLYWVLEPEARFVEVWRPEDDMPTFERQALKWVPAGATAPFSPKLAELFRPI